MNKVAAYQILIPETASAIYTRVSIDALCEVHARSHPSASLPPIAPEG